MLVGRYTVFLDANVMHPAIVRGALLWFATARLFRPLWSEAVLQEWEDSLKRRFRDLSTDYFERQRGYMGTFEEASVAGYESLMPGLELPDAKDVHVLAAAIHGRADAIVTYNLKDFPVEIAAHHQIEVKHPDDFIVNILDLDTAKALTAIRNQREQYGKPPVTAEEYLERFKKSGLIQSAHRLTPLSELF
jgi:predicted nucleic acid-binding protein